MSTLNNAHQSVREELSKQATRDTRREKKRQDCICKDTEGSRVKQKLSDIRDNIGKSGFVVYIDSSNFTGG